MRNYEIVFIMHPDLDEGALNSTIDKVKGWITDASGAITKVEIWGRKKMAYAIRKQSEGHYVYIQAQSEKPLSSEFERNMRFLEPVMRFLVKAVK